MFPDSQRSKVNLLLAPRPAYAPSRVRHSKPLDSVEVLAAAIFAYYVTGECGRCSPTDFMDETDAHGYSSWSVLMKLTFRTLSL